MSFPFVPGETVDVPEIPYQETIQLPSEKTALIIVDMQNDFVKPEGTLEVPSARDTVANIQDLLGRARAKGIRIAYTQDTHYANDPEWKIWPEHCRHGTWGWEIIDELKPQAEEFVFQKSRYDGFYGTALDHYLSRVWEVEHLVIVGTVASICVLHTAASAGLRWYHVVAPAEGMSALQPFDQALALRQISWLYAGHVVRKTADIQFD